MGDNFTFISLESVKKSDKTAEIIILISIAFLIPVLSFVFGPRSVLIELLAFGFVPASLSLAYKMGQRWGLINLVLAPLTILIWYFHGTLDYWVLIITFGASWFVLVLPFIAKNLSKGQTAYADFSFHDFYSHMIFGAITFLIFFDFSRNIPLSYLLSMLFGVLYELAEFLTRKGGFPDLHFDMKNSIFDLIAHLVGCLITELCLMAIQATV